MNEIQDKTAFNCLDAPLKAMGSYQKLKTDIERGRSPILATGVVESQKSHLALCLEKELNTPILYITSSELKAKAVVEELNYFSNHRAVFYPSKDIIFYAVDIRSAEIMQERFRIIDQLLKGRNPVVVLSLEALLDRLVDKERFNQYTLRLKPGDIVKLEILTQQLIKIGYERKNAIEKPGDFSVRGGIVDIFPVTSKYGIRLELWGDEIDSIRMIDLTTQRSTDKVETAEIYPMLELVYDNAVKEAAIKKIKKEYEKMLKKAELQNDTEYLDNLKESIGNDIHKLEMDTPFAGIARYFYYFYQDNISLLDYMPANTIVFIDEPQKIILHTENIMTEYEESVKNRIEKGQFLPTQSKMIYAYHDIRKMLEPYQQVLYMALPHSIKDFTIQSHIHFEVKQYTTFFNKLDLMAEDIHYFIKKQYAVLILGGSKTKCERLMQELSERNIQSYYIEALSTDLLIKGKVAVSKGQLKKGFEYPESRFVLMTDGEMVSKERKVTSRKRKKSASIDHFTDLKIGDYVVHDSHGIGRYLGIEKVVVENTARDFLKIEYAGGGSLYVATSQLDMLQKYIGSEAKAPKISKLGGTDWHKSKTRARKAAEIAAKDLIELYAGRQAEKGFVYSQDTVWQKEFEETFPFEETEDQLQAIEDVKHDMETGVVMDRLICGDVGYGKTEIAIRASFKAVQDGKQVVYLVPTTILAQQHYNTFTSRMRNYPVAIEMLSRFKTAAEQKKIIEDVKKGLVDILIGTHRVLSKDINFSNLGMVIVDEEQRFGVAHKEKLKKLKANVNFLTLTATPIPRTLHMSLTGIRDMSILEEPPEERQPIQTYVLEYNPELIKDAIHRELGRGGQVYYLHNRVSNIAEVSARLRNQLPEARIAYAHGQMSERELEGIMLDFINGDLDVLVCTTIIETGLDISNVNTIIIQDADRMGLSQLYQLRGRVGRSNKIAYAYLCYKKDKVIQENAEKRLQTIKEFTEFGSGFKVAMRDLEIRGTGNLLGAEQHGYMETVGYDMYCKLLTEEIARLRGETVQEAFETSIDLNVDAYLPSYYIEDEAQRLQIYKRIASIKTQADYFDVQEEIEDRFGSLPQCVETLLQVSLTKSIAHSLDIISLKEKQQHIIAIFKNDAAMNPNAINALIRQSEGKILFTISQNPYLTVKISHIEKGNQIEYIKSILQTLKKLNLPSN